MGDRPRTLSSAPTALRDHTWERPVESGWGSCPWRTTGGWGEGRGGRLGRGRGGPPDEELAESVCGVWALPLLHPSAPGRHLVRSPLPSVSNLVEHTR